MSTTNAQAGAISFAHLAGITTPIHAAKADSPSDDDKKDAKKADDDSDDETMEDDEPKKNDDTKEDAKAEADEPDDDDKKDKAKKASTSGVARGVAQERARWTAVLASKSFARNPAVGAHMLANTSMDASGILAVLRDTPATAADAGRAARNPNLGTSAPAVAVSTDTRWGAAFKRAGVLK